MFLERMPPSRASRSRQRWPLVIVANTLPVRRRAGRGGKRRWESAPGGLVSALAPITRRAGGAWVGWSGSAGRAPGPFEHAGITNLPVAVSAAEIEGSYEGVCNRTLWPLYHDAVRQPEYHRHWWRHYVAVNQRFAAAAAAAAARKAIVWVHDYHLQLVPQMLREIRPDVRIGFFLHIPFPPEELFVHLPWRGPILRGLLGADVIGFQTRLAAANFRHLARHLANARGREAHLHVDGRAVEVQAFPISVDFEHIDGVARRPGTASRAAALRSRLGQGRRVFLGVDRLDYTKGIDLRLKAYGEFLANDRRLAKEAVFVQVAVPSRERIAEYQELRRTVEELVGSINGRFGDVGNAAVHYLRRHLPFEELVALYRAADVMLVTPLADGMNLVAKEYVSTRTDDTGALILSEFAGAAPELKAALLVNPHDVSGMTEAMERALHLDAAEGARRMRAMRRVVRRNTVHDWAEAFLGRLRAE